MGEMVTVRLDEEQFDRLLEEVRMANPFYLPPIPPRNVRINPERVGEWNKPLPKWATGMSY